MMTTTRYHNVVLGAGAMGSAAAYQLARRGEPVALIEQFAFGHDRGSSHGAARITRHSYADPVYARLMPAAFDAWRRLEADAGESFYIRTGGVSFSPPGEGYTAQVAASLQELGVAHRRMTGREWNAVEPMFTLGDDFDVVFEPDAGVLKASRALEAERRLAAKLGPKTVLRDRVEILAIDLESSRPTLRTASEIIEAERLIVTAGSWTGRLIPSLTSKLRPTRQAVFYVRPAEADAFALGRFPVFIAKGPGELDAFYGMPSMFGMGVKVARHGGPDADPTQPTGPPAAADFAPVRGFLEACLPGLASAPIERAETCLYTMAPDDHFQVGLFPGRPDVVVASPCSGHGFKFSCLVGAILADLAIAGQTSHAIDAWRPWPAA